MEAKGVECDSMMCGCTNQDKAGTYRAKKNNNYSHRNHNSDSSSNSGASSHLPNEGTTIAFEQFFEIMSAKIREARPTQNIIFETKVSHVSCFLWPQFQHS